MMGLFETELYYVIFLCGFANGIFLLVFEMLVEENVEYVTVSVSDGITDMLIYEKDDLNKITDTEIRMIYELSAEELKDKIQGRWLQDWNVMFMNGHKQCQQWSKDTSDDVSVARMVIRPKM